MSATVNALARLLLSANFSLALVAFSETPSRSTPCKEAWVEEGKADNAKLLWSRREERSV